ncbi:hypothetical protein [Myxacorys almedinensis]|uniref:hypothetical protein n=1 Tax=Myxacorys almedinensis TaxID=2651157 RepID=UPI00192F0E40|nr:hypothetical protein [Myxacorys almedinensis]
MARRKRNSSPLERAERRIESLRSISARLDLGGGLTMDAYAATITDLRSKLALYNTALSSIDKLANDVEDAERLVLELSEKMLLGVGSRYGKTSYEYEMAGGSRRKNARRTTPDPAPTTAPTFLAEASTPSAEASTNGASAAVGG